MKTARLASALAFAGWMLAPGPAHAVDVDSVAVATGVVTGHAFIARTRQAATESIVVLLGTRRGARADSAGQFMFGGVKAGRCDLLAQAAGYAMQRTACVVRAGETTHVEIAFEPDTDLHMIGHFDNALRESLGAEVAGAEDSLLCTIEPLRSHVWLGDRPHFRARVWNRSSRPVVLVPALDGSERVRRPRVRVTFEGPAGGVRARPVLYCGNLNSLRPEQLVTILPGGFLEVFGLSGYADGTHEFLRPGVYTAHVEYATDENDLRAWLGDFQPETLGDVWHARFRHIPRVDLHAECAFEVQER